MHKKYYDICESKIYKNDQIYNLYQLVKLTKLLI